MRNFLKDNPDIANEIEEAIREKVLPAIKVSEEVEEAEEAEA